MKWVKKKCKMKERDKKEQDERERREGRKFERCWREGKVIDTSVKRLRRYIIEGKDRKG